MALTTPIKVATIGVALGWLSWVAGLTCLTVYAADAQWTTVADQAEQKNLGGLLTAAEAGFREALALATAQHAAAPQLHQLQARLACALVLQEKLEAAQPILDQLLSVPTAELLTENGDDEMYYLTALADAYRPIGYRLSGRERLRCFDNSLQLRDLVMGKRSNLAVPVAELCIARVLNDQFDQAALMAKRLDKEISRSRDGDTRNAALFRRIALAYQVKGKNSEAATFDEKATLLYKKSVSSQVLELSKEREAVKFFLEWKMLPEAQKHAQLLIRIVKPPMPPVFESDLLAQVYAAQGNYEKACAAYQQVFPQIGLVDPLGRVGVLRHYSTCLKKTHRHKEAAAIDAQCAEISVQDLKKH